MRNLYKVTKARVCSEASSIPRRSSGVINIRHGLEGCTLAIALKFIESSCGGGKVVGTVCHPGILAAPAFEKWLK